MILKEYVVSFEEFSMLNESDNDYVYNEILESIEPELDELSYLVSDINENDNDYELELRELVEELMNNPFDSNAYVNLFEAIDEYEELDERMSASTKEAQRKRHLADRSLNPSGSDPKRAAKERLGKIKTGLAGRSRWAKVKGAAKRMWNKVKGYAGKAKSWVRSKVKGKKSNG